MVALGEEAENEGGVTWGRRRTHKGSQGETGHHGMAGKVPRIRCLYLETGAFSEEFFFSFFVE